LYDADGKMEFK
jgi:cold-inducible RNA-binding protein